MPATATGSIFEYNVFVQQKAYRETNAHGSKICSDVRINRYTCKMQYSLFINVLITQIKDNEVQKRITSPGKTISECFNRHQPGKRRIKEVYKSNKNLFEQWIFFDVQYIKFSSVGKRILSENTFFSQQYQLLKIISIFVVNDTK